MPTKKNLINALLTSLSFSAFIYLAHFNLDFKLLNTLLALGAFYLFLTVSKKEIILSGFFIGLFWFYWISFSFEYYDFKALIPFVIVGFGFVYALFFAPLALSSNVFIRAVMLILLSFIEPFDFNWMVLELPFINSYFGVEKWQFVTILLSLSLTIRFKKPLLLLLLIAAVNFSTTAKELPPLKIELARTYIPQELKWKRSMRNKIIDENLDIINDAIEKKYDVVVLPESVFPFFMNEQPYLIDYLKKLSKKIAIVAGAIKDEEGVPYNVTYIFNEGGVQVAKKMVLVPFGEYTPLPKFARRWVNEFFFNNALEYKTTSAPSDFYIKGIKFRNAICYEATCNEIYQDDPAYVIAISNNGWFVPSIEPTLQNLLIKYYAFLHNSIVFHTTNMSGSKVVF